MLIIYLIAYIIPSLICYGWLAGVTPKGQLTFFDLMLDIPRCVCWPIYLLGSIEGLTSLDTDQANHQQTK